MTTVVFSSIKRAIEFGGTERRSDLDGIDTRLRPSRVFRTVTENSKVLC